MTEAGPLTSGARRLIDARFSSPVGGGNERKGVLNACRDDADRDYASVTWILEARLIYMILRVVHIS